MKFISKTIYLIIIVYIILALLSGCTKDNTCISNNNYTQTDYNYNCLSNDKTFTEIILCYQQQDASEKAQNHITNELITNNK